VKEGRKGEGRKERKGTCGYEVEGDIKEGI
jgi:hypothetical protein